MGFTDAQSRQDSTNHEMGHADLQTVNYNVLLCNNFAVVVRSKALKLYLNQDLKKRAF